MSSQLALLQMLLEEYDELSHLECDGFSRVASYILKTNGISHVIYAGQCVVGENTVEPHFWITAGKYTIDYRLRMWVGESAPHGVFETKNHPSVKYHGESVQLPVSSVLFEVLLEPPPFKKEA